MNKGDFKIMEIKVLNFNTKESKIIEVQANNLVDLLDKLVSKYGSNFIIAKDLDKGQLFLNNGYVLEDIKQNEKYKQMKKYC